VTVPSQVTVVVPPPVQPAPVIPFFDYNTNSVWEPVVVQPEPYVPPLTAFVMPGSSQYVSGGDNSFKNFTAASITAGVLDGSISIVNNTQISVGGQLLSFGGNAIPGLSDQIVTGRSDFGGLVK
jgi:hypothetical protein